MKEKNKENITNWIQKNWFQLLGWIFALFFVGYSAFSLDPDINWIARLVGFVMVLYFFVKFLPLKTVDNSLDSSRPLREQVLKRISDKQAEEFNKIKKEANKLIQKSSNHERENYD